MSVEVTGLWGDVALFADENGPAEIPVRDLARLHALADMSRDCKVTRLGRRFHRDTLARPLRDFENGEMPVLDDCDFCRDAPGTQDMGDGRKACPPCCAGAAGSGYDDRNED